MIRRMKIKASPNLGGIKRNNVIAPGKKIQQDSSNEQSCQNEDKVNSYPSTTVQNIIEKTENSFTESANTPLNNESIKSNINYTDEETTKLKENNSQSNTSSISPTKENNKSIDILKNNDEVVSIENKTNEIMIESAHLNVENKSLENKITKSMGIIGENNSLEKKSSSSNINKNSTVNEYNKDNKGSSNQDLISKSLQSQLSPSPLNKTPINTKEIHYPVSNASTSQFLPKEDVRIGNKTDTSNYKTLSIVQNTLQSVKSSNSSHNIVSKNDNHSSNKELNSLPQDKDSLMQESLMSNKKENVLIKAPKENIKSSTTELKSKITSSVNLVSKMGERRARIKGCPIINKRPPKPPPLSSETKNTDGDSNENKVAILENRNNNDPKVSNEESIKSHKENCLTLSSSQVDTKKSHESKENINEKYLKKMSTSKPSLKELNTNRSVNKKKYSKAQLNSIIESEELMKDKKMFHERKLKYRKKLLSGKLDRNEMTMFDLIFWNPATNPMPGRNEEERINRRNNSFNETESITSEIIEEHKAEEEGLQTTSNEDHSKDTHTSENDADDNDDDDDDDEEAASTLAPQVKIGPNGDLIVDEKSLVIQTTAAKNRDEILSRTEVVEEPTESSHYGKWSKKRKRSTEWTRKETARFYKALSSVGTDFSLMETVFKWRSRSELKIKFKKEEKINRQLIDTALNDCTQFDFSIFEESDYDPEEDRKEAKEAEKAEAKKKREMEREQRKLQKEIERKRRKEELQEEKQRKKTLKTIYKKQKRRKKVLKTPRLRTCSTSSEKLMPQEVICELIFSNKNGKEGTQSYAESESTIEETATPSDIKLNQNCKDSSTSAPFASLGADNSAEMMEIVEVGSDEKIVLSPLPNHPSDGDKISNSCFNVNDSSTNIQSTFVVQSEAYCDSSNSQHTSPIRKENQEDSIAATTVQTNVRPEMYQHTHETQESEIDVLMKEAEAENNRDLILEEVIEGDIQSDNLELDKQDTSQFCIPVENVQKSSDGNYYVEINTKYGTKKILVPCMNPQTSHFVVLEAPDPQNSVNRIYHIYTVAPVDNSTTEQGEPNTAESESDGCLLIDS